MLDIYPTETQSKPMDLYIKENYKEELIGLEIGVWDGIHAKNLLTILPNLKKLYLIDPFIEYMDGRINRGDLEVWRALVKFKGNILDTELNDRTKFIHKTSSDAINEIPDGMDFIYIDANHSYEYIKEDIRLYYPKVRRRGVFGGDDYNYPRHQGVTDAVDEFIKDNELQLHTERYKLHTSCKSPDGWIYNTDWWIIKDKNGD